MTVRRSLLAAAGLLVAVSFGCGSKPEKETVVDIQTPIGNVKVEAEKSDDGDVTVQVDTPEGQEAKVETE